MSPSNYWNRKLGNKESRRYDNKFIKGVHTPRMPYPGMIQSFSESDMGYQIRGMQQPGSCGAEYHWFTAIRIHVENLEALIAMPNPKLKGI